MTDHAKLRRLDDSEVEQLLERYIKRFPGEHKAAMSRYFEAVHQELAPLARKLEAERDRLKAENEALRGALQAVVDDPTWRSNDNTLWPKIIKAMYKGAKP
ncbi:ead/Ea22-like family protein [Pseudomonas aeruginosa]|uniref:ead/Ea22-like family protein n=1 Tax=Pseudomonas aeruginosa TaxID=287 RepID=UPI000FD53E3B|nr:ead/Ea22-like family protein [Pseudomonas aeruginosa]RUK51217.1 ead/Ea22-like family protein [Pseudomonas aeruginosa]